VVNNKKKHIIYSILFGLILCLATYGFFIEPYNIEVKDLNLNDLELGKAIKGKTALYISDLHIGKIGKREKKVLDIIREVQPDFIFLTGDYVEWQGDYDPALAFLSKLEARTGIWAVMGDYDYSSSRKSCLFCHERNSGNLTGQHQVRFLRNSYDRVSLPEGDLLIGGLDNEDEGYLEIGDHMIILSHDPLRFKEINRDADVLVLSGDTHGGQIPVPAWLWKVLGYEKNTRFNQGFFQDGKKRMYVTRGVGTSHVRFRLFSRPEVVVLHF
jgi:predicted MPP superfamily phosphohydrolase